MGGVLVTGITFGVFMTEALIHYNMGMAKAEGGFKLRLPPAVAPRPQLTPSLGDNRTRQEVQRRRARATFGHVQASRRVLNSFRLGADVRAPQPIDR